MRHCRNKAGKREVNRQNAGDVTVNNINVNNKYFHRI